MAELLSDIEIQRMLGKIPGWSRKGDSITKTFQFKDFLSGIDFVEDVKCACAREGVPFDHDIFNELVS